MSNNDSFINEVSEEVRRDRLFALLRRYGWIGILAVVLMVGGAAYNEWRKARDTAAAEALGDSILSALAAPDAAARVGALQRLAPNGNARDVVELLLANAAAGSDMKAAVAALQSVADDKSQPKLYRQLAQLKSVMLQGPAMDKTLRQTTLKTLAIPGAPFRLLAEEQLALMAIEAGDTAGAITRLQGIYADSEATPGLRQRASQLIVALGGQLETS